MYKLLIGSTCLIILASCNNRPQKINNDSLIADSIRKQKEIDSQMALGNRSESEEVSPSFDEVKNELVSRYDKVERIDTTIVVGQDSLHVHEKYYCLKHNAIVIPKKYLWGGDKTKDFVTHSFVSSIVIIKNNDTIINKTFQKRDFDQVVNQEERQYAIIFDAGLLGYKKQYESIVFSYNISIPLTDVGVPAYIAINKNGGYKILDAYAKFDDLRR